MRRLLSSAAARHSLVMLYDGSCPLCVREVAWLAGLRRAGRVQFTDVTASSFTPPAGSPPRTMEQLLNELHVFEPATLEMHVRVPAFRRLYHALFGVDVLFLTQFWPLSAAADSAYSFIARHKHRLAWLFEKRP